MTDAPPSAPAFRTSRFFLAMLLGFGGHLLAYGGALLAARLVEPSQGGGFEDLAAAVSVFVGVELLVALACLVVGITLIVKGRRDRGAGLLLGWLIGVVAVFVAISV